MGKQIFLCEHSSLLEKPVVDKNLTFSLDEKKNGDLFFEGPFGVYDILNLNKRRYRKPIMEKSIKDYNEIYVKGRRAVSELGHPENSDINLHYISHAIYEPLELREGNIVFGRAKVLPKFPRGKILYEYLKEGLVLGVSTRGLGEVEEQEEGEGDLMEKIFDVIDFTLSAFDCVWEPSIGKFINIVGPTTLQKEALDLKSLMKLSRLLIG
jgi:hypothetical protein